MHANKFGLRRWALKLVQLGTGCAVAGIFLIVYGFPIRGFVVSGASLLGGGLLVVVLLLILEQRSGKVPRKTGQ